MPARKHRPLERLSWLASPTSPFSNAIFTAPRTSKPTQTEHKRFQREATITGSGRSGRMLELFKLQ